MVDMRGMASVRFSYVGNGALLYGGEGITYATPCSVGLDLRACIDGEKALIPAGERFAVPAGIAVEPMEPGIAGFIYARSGLGAKRGLTVAQGVGVIDPDYRGELVVVLLNTSSEPLIVRRGDRVAQLVFQPVCRVQLEPVERLGATLRGSGAFGHTGR